MARGRRRAGSRSRTRRRSPRAPARSRAGICRGRARANGCAASRMRRFARTSRCAIVGPGTANARAICSASKPSTAWSMSGVRTAGSIAGWAQTNSSASRRSGIASGSSSSATARAPPRTASSSGRVSRSAAVRRRSRRRLRATVSSQPSGLSGTPSRATSAAPARRRRRGSPRPLRCRRRARRGCASRRP